MRVGRWASILVIVALGAWAFRVLLEVPEPVVQPEAAAAVAAPEKTVRPPPESAPVELTRDGMVRYVGRVVDGDGAALSGVSVAHVPNAHSLGDTIMPLEGGKVERRLPRGDMAKVQTAVDGTFTVVAPEPRAISGWRWPHAPMLVIDAPGFATRPVACHMTMGDTKVDVGVIELEPDIIVSGRVIDAETQTVQEEAVVRAWSVTTSERWSQAVDTSYWGALDYRRDAFGAAEATSTSKGRFKVRGLSGGLFAVEISREGFATWRSEGLSADPGSTIDLGTVELAPAHVLGIEATDARDGKALKDVKMTAALIRPEAVTKGLRERMIFGHGIVDEEVIAVDRSNSRGELVIRELDDTVYTIVVTAPGYESQLIESWKPQIQSTLLSVALKPLRRIPLFREHRPSRRLGSTDAWVTGSASSPDMPLEIHRDGGRLHLLAPSEREVVVRFAVVGRYPRIARAGPGETQLVDDPLQPSEMPPSVRGVVVDQSNQPVPGATVWIRGAGWANEVYARSVVTDDDGEFCIRHAFAGDQELIAEAAGYATDHFGTTVDADKKLHKVRLDKLSVLRGTLLDEEGVPAVGANVTLSPPQFSPYTGFTRDTGVETATTLHDGTFEFQRLEPGEWTLKAPGVVTEEIDIRPGRATEIDLTLRPGISARTLPGADSSPFLGLHLTRLRGHVRREKNAIAFAVVSWRGVEEDPTEARHLVTDAAGFFEIDVGEAGDYMLSARAPDGSLTAPVHAVAFAESTVDVELHCGAWSMAGTIEVNDAMRDLDLSLVLRQVQSGAVQRHALNRGGRFEFRQLARAPVVLDLMALGMVIHSFPIDEIAPDVGTLRVGGYGRVKVRVDEKDEHAFVTVEAVGGRRKTKELDFSTGNSGAVGGLPTGVYNVTVHESKADAMYRYLSKQRVPRHQFVVVSPDTLAEVHFK